MGGTNGTITRAKYYMPILTLIKLGLYETASIYAYSKTLKYILRILTTKRKYE